MSTFRNDGPWTASRAGRSQLPSGGQPAPAAGAIQAAKVPMSALQAGDEVRKGDRSYVVEGYTVRGKIILRRQSGTILTAWWSKVSDLPKGYRRVSG